MFDILEELVRTVSARLSGEHRREHAPARVPKRMRPHVARSTFTPVYERPAPRSLAA